jgi:hypothetical protein
MSNNGQDLFPLRRKEVIRIGMMFEEHDTGDPVLEEKLGEPEVEDDPAPVTGTQETYSLQD